jgi:DNA-binding transcriptional LysR family regulator
MDLRHLRYFIGIVDAGSMALAGRRLHISQPTLSRQIRDLERDLGVRLFDRVGRRVVLTAEGREMAARTRHVLADVEALRARGTVLGGGSGGVLRVGATPQFIEAGMPDVLSAYRRTHPGVEVQLSEEGARPLIARVAQGELHIAIGALRDIEQLASRPLYPLRVLAVMSRRHPLASRRDVAVQDLAGERLLMLAPGFQTRQLFEDAAQGRYSDLHVVLESRSPQSLVALAAAGHGIAIIPSVVALARTRVAIVGLVHNGRPLGLWGRVVWDPRRYLPPYAETFVETLARYTKRSFPGHRLRVTRGVERPVDGDRREVRGDSKGVRSRTVG